MKKLTVLIFAALVCGISSASEPVTLQFSPSTLMGEVQTGEAASFNKVASSPKFVLSQEEEDALIKNPEGREVRYNAESYGLYLNIFSSAIVPITTKRAAIFVWGENNEVYLKMAVTSGVPTYQVEGYVKGIVEDNMITFNYPQLITYVHDSEGNNIPLYASVMKYDNGSYMPVADEENYVKYTIHEDGSIVLNDEGMYTGEIILNDDGSLTNVPPKVISTYETYNGTPSWWCNSDCQQTFTPLEANEVELPSTAELQSSWILTSPSIQPHLITLAFDGNDVYIAGLSNTLPDNYVKGVKDDGKIILSSRQLVGLDEKNMCYIYFMTGTLGEVYYPDWDVTMPDNVYCDNLVLIPNENENSYSALSPDDFFVFDENFDDVVEYFEYPVKNPEIFLQHPEMTNSPLLKPELIDAFEEEEDEVIGYVGMRWQLSNITDNGGFVLPESISYNLYVNDKLFTFTPEYYPQLETSIADVPFTLNTKNIYYYPSGPYNFNHVIYIFKDDFEETINKVGIKVFHYGADGNCYESISQYVFVNSNVTSISHDSEESCVEYYTLNGLRVTKEVLTSGIYVKRIVWADGSTTTEKIVIR